MRSWSLNLTQPGWLILIAIMALVGIGVASIYVTDTHYLVGHDGPRNAAKQLIRVVVSLLVAWWVLRVGHQAIGRYAYFHHARSVRHQGGQSMACVAAFIG